MLPLLRYTLDLFAPPATTAVAASPAAAPLPFQPGEPLSRAIDPAVFRHPRANRESRIADAIVGYEFSRAKRSTIGFSIGPDGLTVRAPRWTPLYAVEAAVQEKGRWILEKLHAARERRQRHDSAAIIWRDGAVVPYMGGSLVVTLDPTHAFVGTGAALQPGPTPQLRVGLPHNASEEQIRDVVQAWLMRQAKCTFLERIAHFAPLLGVQVRSMRLSNAGTRWGSASADGSVRLNWRLIHFRQSVIDYVVAHELSHLRVMDHSPRFWETVASVVPDYSVLRRQLKDDGIPRW